MTLNKVGWIFNDRVYTKLEEFIKDVSNYQIRVKGNDSDWKPEEILLNSPEIQIQYMTWIEGPEDILENEHLITEDANIFEEEDEEYQVEIIALFKADNGKYFTAGEFLMKTHNTQANKWLGDHVFFEGLDDEPSIIDGLPTFYIACGS